MGDTVTTGVQLLLDDAKVGPQIIDSIYLPPHPVAYGELDPPLHPALAASLAEGGIDRLWSHQAEGLAALRRGENVLVTTPTASGKSLVFQAPVLEEALDGGSGRALFLYPLKALGQDQKAKFDAMAAAVGLDEAAAGCAIYDGDTPRSRREKIKKRFPRVIVSNPEMLHLAVLGYWHRWAPFLRSLRWIVLDELHTYRGIFGSHFHQVLARLLRLCREEGSAPQIIASSATAANAGEFAESLVGQPFHWIQETGAPREGRHLLLVQPDASPYTTTLQLLVRLLESGLKTIVFTKARRITELLYQWLGQQRPELAERVANYRSGFLPEERRRIERELFEGRLDGVISTSALEMGIDVGGLDACVLVGFPGSIMATWQRSGRVGRDGRESITALVALPDALDQYLLHKPRELVERSCEQLIVDPLNQPVTRAHLACAAAEKPLRRAEDREYIEPRRAQVDTLVRSNVLVEAADGRELYSRELRPGRHVHLRGAGASYTILNARDGKLVGTVDGVRAQMECHPGAIYLHSGRQFLVRELDLDARKVHAEAVHVEYFTTAQMEKETEIREVLEERRDGEVLKAWLGRLEVTERVVGYERKRIQGQEVIDQHPLELPPVHFETVGLWWAAPAVVEEGLKGAPAHFLGSLHAAEHAAISLFPLVALCDRGDIGGISIPNHPQLGTGCVFIYDGHPGGIGIAERGFRQLPELLGRVADLVDSCDCEIGCPSCVHSPKCGNGNRPLDKEGCLLFLRWLLEREPLAGAEHAVLPEVRIEPARETIEHSVTAPSPSTSAAIPVTRPPEVAVPPSGPVVPIEPPEPTPAPAAPLPAPADPSSPDERLDLPPVELLAPPRNPRHTVLFDLETQRSAADVGGWGNVHRMLVAVGVVCHMEEGRWEVFREDRLGELVASLEAADRVIGFNIARFDYRVLMGYTGIDYARRLPTLDLLEHVRQRAGFRLSLDHLARETLGVGKSADGLQSLEWVRQGRLDLVEEYCRKDVEAVRDLFLFGWRMGFVHYLDKKGRKVKLSVDW